MKLKSGSNANWLVGSQCRAGFLAAAMVWLLSHPLHATTILGLDIDEIARRAELIFEGKVIERNIQYESGSGMIYTFVTFTVSEVIKGDSNLESLELRFTGGEKSGERVAVSGLVIPEPGETGIYFVESSTRPLLNPLLGWSQGHFIVLEEDGEPRVYTADRSPITDLRSVTGIPVTIRRPRVFSDGKSAAAAGVVTGSSELQLNRALPADEFKNRVRELIEP